MDYEVVIIGAGPSGVACAVQLARQGRSVMVVEKGSIGGLVRNAGLVENLPGFPAGITGLELAMKLGEHLAASGARIVNDEVKALQRDGSGWKVATGAGLEIACKAVVFATGTRPRHPEWLSKGTERGLHFEVADLPLDMGGKKAAVLGGGDVAYDYSTTLAARGAKVTILTRSPPRSVEVLKERVEGDDAINVCQIGVNGASCTADGVCVDCEGDELGTFDVFVIAIGRVAEDSLFKEASAQDCEGLFLIGDAAHPRLRQVAIGAGDGVRTAMELQRRLG